jgi:hypothetical protein
VGLNTLEGPGEKNVDFALLKTIPLGESRHIEFRAEAFNVLNHTNLTGVNVSYNGATSTSFGTINAAADPRILEFAGRFHF